MRYITWTDEDGYTRRAAVLDGEEDGRRGIPAGPPDVERIDWDAVKRELHQALAERGLWKMEDVLKQQRENGVQGAILSVLRRRVIDLYREEETIGG